jgi:hypothetical protein
MQIKTAIAIGSGVVIGTMIGMCVDEDKKIKLIDRLKKKLIYAMTGEEWKPKKCDPYKPSYTSYNGLYKEKVQKKKKDDEFTASLLLNYLLTFETYELASDFLLECKKYLDTYNHISVHDLAMMANKHVNYTWDAYGWTKKRFLDYVSIKEVDGGMYRLLLSDPILLESKAIEKK